MEVFPLGEKREQFNHYVRWYSGLFTKSFGIAKEHQAYLPILIGLLPRSVQYFPPALAIYVDQLPPNEENLGYLASISSAVTEVKRIVQAADPARADIPDELVVAFIDPVKALYQAILPHMLNDLIVFKAALGLNFDDLRKLPSALNDHERIEQERQKAFGKIKDEFSTLKNEVESLKTVKPFIAYEDDLNAKEKGHVKAIWVCVGGLVLPVSLWLSSFACPPISKYFVQYKDVQPSTSVWIDLLGILKVLSPSIVAVLVTIVLLRFAFLERHNLLMLRQRRDILKLGVSVLAEYHNSENVRTSILEAFSNSAFAYYPTGYGRKEADFTAEAVDIAKKLRKG